MSSETSQDTTNVELTFLGDGKQQPDQVAQRLAAFIAGATRSLDIAIYDCAPQGTAGDILASAIKERAAAGVGLRIAYYAGPHRSPIMPPPRGSPEEYLAGLGVPNRPITGYQALMHHKYVIRDESAVWTGSTNWTNDAWSREENVILEAPSPGLAGLYQGDFEDLWDSGKVENSGKSDGGSVSLAWGGEPLPCQVWFSPGQGRQMAHAVAEAVCASRDRVVIASPVLTVGTLLGAIRDLVDQGRVPVTGICDRTQMAQVRRQWLDDQHASWKIQAFADIARAAQLAGKRSTPFAPGAVHDYMHLKMIVVDDTVFTGSYNFSHSGEENAENLLRLDRKAFADGCVEFINGLIERYNEPGANVAADW